MKEKENGYLYLIFQKKIKEDQQLYKIGKTEDIIRRFKQHQRAYKDSKLISTAYCSNYNDNEKILIKVFNDNFKLVKGREYFSGKHKDILRIFHDITRLYIIEPFITSKLSWPPLTFLKHRDGSDTIELENDDWKDITKNFRHSKRIMTYFYLEDLWKNATKKEYYDMEEHIYDDPKCCLCKEFCTKNSNVGYRFECSQCWVKFCEEKEEDEIQEPHIIPFCDVCFSDNNLDKSFYLFIRSYKYGKCILEEDHHFRMND